jgi:hypothetical protein
MTFCKLMVLCAAFSRLSPLAQAQWEVEADPTAYALKGFSAHVGHRAFGGRSRLQFGAFGAETPEWIHGNNGFTEDSRGVTLKVDYFLHRPAGGFFFGADSNYARVRYELAQTHERTYRNLVGVGPRVGYRLNLGKHLYLSPWVSVDYQWNAKDITISAKTFRQGRFSLFPALHLGWTFP